MEGFYRELLEAVALSTDRAIIRIRVSYEPSGGEGARIFPPTYPAERGSPYVIEKRCTDSGTRQDVLLDSVPSQANRAEQALLQARDEGRVELPMLQIDHVGTTPIRLTSLDLPHRYADAYLLDSEIDGAKFDRSEIGRSFQAATPQNATALFQHDPGSLVFGAWNSHRKGRQAKFPRVYSSEIIGWDPEIGERKAGRMDPLNLTGGGTRSDDGDLNFIPVAEKVKGQKLSELGHGNIAPNSTHGGVTVSSAERFATISLAALDRLGFGPVSSDAAIAGRVALAAYALLADRLAFGGPSLWLRSGCELIVTKERFEWVTRGGGVEPIELGASQAIELYNLAVAESARAGLAMTMEPLRLTPGKGLRAAIDFALSRADSSGE